MCVCVCVAPGVVLVLRCGNQSSETGDNHAVLLPGSFLPHSLPLPVPVIPPPPPPPPPAP